MESEEAKLQLGKLITEKAYYIATAEASPSHPNVALIIVDDLRPTLGCYGDPVAITPNIDKLASRGLLFSRAYAQQALCGPSRTSFLTSRHPDTTKLIDVHYYWRNHAGNYTSLPQYFKEHGYHTAAAGKVFHPGIVSNHTDDQPYSWSETPYHPSTQQYKQAPVCLGKDGKLHTNIYCPVEVDEQPEGSIPDIQTKDYVVNWLQKRAMNSTLNSKPFFLAVGFHKPHVPLKFPKEFLDLYSVSEIPLAPNRVLPAGLPAVAWNPWNDLRRREDIAALNVSFPYGPLPDFYARYVRQGYYAATSYADYLIGEVLHTLQDLFPDTLVALIGDHGWSLGEHQEWSKFSNFEVATRVPFIITKLNSYSEACDFYAGRSHKYVHHELRKKLGVKKRSFSKLAYLSYNGIVELVDLFPTLVDLAGLKSISACPHKSKILTCTEGKSLSPIFWKLLGSSSPSSCSENHLDCTLGDRKSSRGFQPQLQVKSNEKQRILKKLNFLAKLKDTPAFSQYPRPSLTPSIHPDSDQPKLKETEIMGYSVRTHRYRYTVWLQFNYTTFEKNWSRIYAEELYDHAFDEGEDHNVVHKQMFQYSRSKMLKRLYDTSMKSV